MPKIAILEIYPNKNFDRTKVIDAHLRNSLELEKYLDADLLLTEQDYLKALHKSYDVMILPYAAFYAPFQLIGKLCEKNPNAKKVIITNEYNLCPTVSTFTPPYTVIANYEKCKIAKKSVTAFHCVNLNLLLAQKPNALTEKKYDCIYYGTYRPNRAQYFKKYLQRPMWVSTSAKNFKKYKHDGCDPFLIKKLSWEKGAETLNLFRYSLYIEDEFTHTCFNNLANRWYEAGFCNNVTFFDKSCLNTIAKSELKEHIHEVSNYVVNSKQELDDKIKECNKEFHKHLEIQKSWRSQEMKLRADLLEQIKAIVNS